MIKYQNFLLFNYTIEYYYYLLFIYLLLLSFSLSLFFFAIFGYAT